MTFRYAVQSTPVGPVTVVEGPRGVVAVEFGETPVAAIAARLAAALGEPIELEKRARLSASTEIAEYFRGRRRVFSVRLDFCLANAFQRQVLSRLARVGYGELTTYGELAKGVGKPGASRAVGVAMAKNPLPLLVPCHRVVAADGSLGGFSGGLDVKRKLHEHEGLRPLSGGWISKRERESRATR